MRLYRRATTSLFLLVPLSTQAMAAAPKRLHGASKPSFETLIEKQDAIIREQRTRLDSLSRRLVDVETRLASRAEVSAVVPEPISPPRFADEKTLASSLATSGVRTEGSNLRSPNRRADDDTVVLAQSKERPSTDPFVVPKGFIGIPGTSAAIKIGGRVQVDSMYYPNAGAGESEDFLVPRLINGNGRHFNRARISARDSRLSFDFRMPASFGQVRAFTEFDFLNTAPANAQAQVNNYEPRLRHVYLEVGPGKGAWTLLAGQNWSAFVNVQAYADLYNGLPFGSVFVRQPQIRLTKWFTTATSLALSIENPEGDVSGATGAGGAEQFDGLPDFVATARSEQKWGALQAGLLVRRIDETSPEGKRTTWGVNLGGNINVPGTDRDNIRFQVNYGNGIGRYIGELGVNFDGRSRTLGSFDRLHVFAGNVSFEHYFNRNWYSTVGVSQVSVDNPYDIIDSLRRTRTASVNGIYAPTPGLEFGLEITVANKTLEPNETETRTVSRLTSRLVF